MLAIKTFMKKYSTLTYFALTFIISTGGIFIIVIQDGLPINMFTSPMLPLALFVGPSIAGITMTGIVSGRSGFRELISRLLRWRVGIRWYAVALLTTPLLATPILLTLSLFSPEFLPAIVTTEDKVSLLLMGAMAGLIGGCLEELGWTGFAIPRLRLRYDALSTALILGGMWAAWHVPVTFWSTVDPSGALSMPLFVPPLFFYLAVLPAYRVLMVWVYDRTESLLVAMLMHTSLAACTFVILLPPATGVSLTIYYLLLATVLWIVVAVVQRFQTLPQQGRGNLPVPG